MDIRKIKKLIDPINETGVMEIELHETNDKGKEESVRISRASMTNQIAPAPAPAPAVNHAPQTALEPTSLSPAPSLPEATKAPSGHAIKSPMVGTVYLAATPGAKPFVEIGQHINEGQTICVIEAMKMFNQIIADKSGTLSARLVENEQIVEFDQDLFILEE